MILRLKKKEVEYLKSVIAHIFEFSDEHDANTGVRIYRKLEPRLRRNSKGGWVYIKGGAKRG